MLAPILHAQQLLQQARYVVALTGAGISTPSGIPDFRTRESGLWAESDPSEVATIQSFRRYPEKFYRWIRPLADKILAAQPNAAHLALKELERFGPLRSIITQNIDMLHTKAGSRVLHELHGHLREAECLTCRQKYNAEGRLQTFISEGIIPLCHHCGDVLKPCVTLFGEQLPWHALHHAEQEALRCDVMLVVGSSLEVAPAGDLPERAFYNGAKLIMVNFGPTHLDHLAEVVIRADAAEILPQLAAPFIVQNCENAPAL